MIAFVTGAAGFIGSNLVDRLLREGHEVIGYDNLSTGQREFLTSAVQNEEFTLVEGDLLDTHALASAMRGADFVFHLAANADVRHGLKQPRKDLEQNTIATFNVLEAMRTTGVRNIAFSSTGSVYGEASIIPTPEDAPFPVQTSLYSASKVAGEALLQAYCVGYDLRGYIFRLASILGERYTHGHVFDFYKQLLEDPTRLRVLGDGTQRKSYLYIEDCLDAILHVTGAQLADSAPHHVAIHNLGTEDYCQVRDSIGWICAKLGLEPRLNFAGGRQGWVGDNPFIFLDTAKVRKTGWAPKLNIRQGVERTVTWLQKNPWVLERR